MSTAALAAGAALVAALGGWWLGDHLVRGEWAEADLARERAAAVLSAQFRRTAADASDRYEARVQLARAKLPEARHDLQTALQSPVSCVDGAPLVLADVPVPASVLDGLRRAAGGVSADRPATSEPGSALLARP